MPLVPSPKRAMPWQAGVVSLHAKVKGRSRPADENEPTRSTEVLDTTPGRMILAELLPKKAGVKPALVNQLLTKKAISGMIDAVYRNCGREGDGDLLRPDHVARLQACVQGRHLVRQGRHADSRQQGEDRRADDDGP